MDSNDWQFQIIKYPSARSIEFNKSTLSYKLLQNDTYYVGKDFNCFNTTVKYLHCKIKRIILKNII
jgi:hypothetical protein